VDHFLTGTVQSAAGLCAEVEGGSTTNGAPIEMNACSVSKLHQNWVITDSHQLRNESSLKCAARASEVAGAELVQKSCSETSDLQKWRFGEVEIINGKTGHCLDVAGGSEAVGYWEGLGLVHWYCHGEDNQRFRYRPATSEIAIGGYCLDAGAGTVGSDVTLRTCDGSPSQEWSDKRGGLVNKKNGLCMAVQGGADAGVGAKIELQACTDKVGQMWGLRGPITSWDGDNCLAAGASGSQLHIAQCNSSASKQLFVKWSAP
jgi:hypothetical protein